MIAPIDNRMLILIVRTRGRTRSATEKPCWMSRSSLSTRRGEVLERRFITYGTMHLVADPLVRARGQLDELTTDAVLASLDTVLDQAGQRSSFLSRSLPIS